MMISPALLADLQRHINAADLSSHADAILATARPAVDLILDGESTGTIGESRFGGAPDLPVGIDWPRNAQGELLTFLAQINLAEIPEFDDNPLPARGWLSVFIGLDEPASDVENRLFLVDGDAKLAPATAPANVQWANDEDYVTVAAQKLRLNLRADIPHWATSDLNALAEAIAPEEIDAYDREEPLEEIGRSLAHYEGTQSIGQLLGHASGIGQDPREDAFVVREVGAQFLYDYQHRQTLDMKRARNWLNLLCLDSFRQGDFDFCIWDTGYLNFLIHRDDLAKLDLSRIYAAVESS